MRRIYTTRFPRRLYNQIICPVFYFVAHTLGLPTMYMKMKHETLDAFIEIQDIKEFETQETP